MEDIDGGLHPAVDGQSLDEDEDEVNIRSDSSHYSSFDDDMMIIAFNGATRFFTISSLRREPSPTRTLKWSEHNHVQITCNISSAYRVQHVV